MDTSINSISDEVNSQNPDHEPESLVTLEKLDRLSPDLWPEQLTGLYDYASLVNSPVSKLPMPSLTLSDQDQSLLYQFGALSPDELIDEVRKLLNVAYQLGVEEAKQMTRGKYLHVLTTPKDSDSS